MKQLEKQESRLESVEKKLSSPVSSSASSSGERKKPKVSLVVKVHEVYPFCALDCNIVFLLLFLQFRLKFAVYIVLSLSKMKISLASILKKGKIDDAHVYNYVCLTPLDTGYRSSLKDAMNKKIVQRLIKEVKGANPSYEAGDIQSK